MSFRRYNPLKNSGIDMVHQVTLPTISGNSNPCIGPIIESGSATPSGDGLSFISTSTHTWMTVAEYNTDQEFFTLPLQNINSTIYLGYASNMNGSPSQSNKWNFNWRLQVRTDNRIELDIRKNVNNGNIIFERTDIMKVKLDGTTNQMVIYKNNIEVSRSTTFAIPYRITMAVPAVNAVLPIPDSCGRDVVSVLGVPDGPEVNIPYISQKHILLDGVDEYIDFGVAAQLAGICDFTQNWSISFVVRADLLTTASSAVFVNGENFVAIEGNTPGAGVTIFSWGNASTRRDKSFTSGGNNHLIHAGDRITLVYDSTVNPKRLKFYKNTTQLSSQTQNIANGALGNCSIGGQGGVSFFSTFLSAAIDGFFVTNTIMTSAQMQDAINDANLANHSWYGDVVAWWPMGEDPFSTVLDVLGNANGNLINGESGDFGNNL